MKNTTINDVFLLSYSYIHEYNGILLPIELNSLIFKPKRVFFVSGVPNNEPRGCHAHYKTKQILTCLHDIIHVKVFDGINYKGFTLTKNMSIYIPELIWDEQVYNSNNSILFSICNTAYNSNDYIHDIDEFKKLKLNE